MPMPKFRGGGRTAPPKRTAAKFLHGAPSSKDGQERQQKMSEHLLSILAKRRAEQEQEQEQEPDPCSVPSLAPAGKGQEKEAEDRTFDVTVRAPPNQVIHVQCRGGTTAQKILKRLVKKGLVLTSARISNAVSKDVKAGKLKGADKAFTAALKKQEQEQEQQPDPCSVPSLAPAGREGEGEQEKEKEQQDSAAKNKPKAKKRKSTSV